MYWKSLDGAFSLVWHDTRNNTLNFARNDERPLCLAYAHGIVYWASEELMLRWLLDRNKIHNPVFMTLPIGQHHVLDLSKKLQASIALYSSGSPQKKLTLTTITLLNQRINLDVLVMFLTML